MHQHNKTGLPHFLHEAALFFVCSLKEKQKGSILLLSAFF